MYEVGPLRLADFMFMLLRDEYATFRRFEAIPVSLTSYMQPGIKTLEEAFNDIRGHCSWRVMVAVKLITPQLFDTSYASCSEEVTYVLRVAVLLDKV